MQATGIGTFQVHCNVDGHKVTLHLHDMLYVPNMSTTLISVSQILKRKGQVVFERSASDKLRGGLYQEIQNDCDWNGNASGMSMLGLRARKDETQSP
jgi:hypothetical protein